ncbi:hypothetical protein BGZ81_003282, partial [Podila clonocystis]
MIGFECLNHRIGRAELEWMAKSWPKLNLTIVLDKERLYDIEPSQERAALEEYFQQLRPDVVHDSFTMIENFARIPELVGLLSRYLHPQDLFVCVQVSSQWHHEFIPFLWHTVDDTTLAWKSILWQCGDSATRSCYRHLDRRVKDSDKDKDREWLMHVFRKYGRHIRELSIHWPMVLEAASMSSQWHNGSDSGEGCVFLRSLTLEIKSAPVPGLRFDAADRQAYGEQVSPIPRGGWGPILIPPPPPPVAMLPITVSTAFPELVEEDDFIQPEHYKSTVEFQKECVEAGWVLTQHFWKLIRSSHGLERLIIGRGPVLQWRIKSEQVLLNAIAQMPHLQELQCWGLNNMADIWKLLLAAPTLKSLTTFCRQFQLPNPLPNANTTLRTLSFLPVRCDGMSMSINNLLEVLRLFPNLSSLTLRKISSFVTQEQQQQQQPQPTGFVGLPLSILSRQVQRRDPSIGVNLRELVVESITDYDALLTHLPDHVDLTCAASLGDCWPLALVERGPIFSVFRDTNPPAFAAEDDPVNELFVASSQLRVFNSIEQCIRVDELLRQPWACMGLEWLSCRIVGVERLTDAEQYVVDRVMAPAYAASLSAEEGAAVEKFQRCCSQHRG